MSTQPQRVLTLPRFERNTRYNICLTTLVGIPAAGKTTFVEQLKELDRTHQLIFKIVHICYDDFILIDRNFEDFSDNELRLMKRQRNLVQRFVKQLLRSYKAEKKQSKLYAQLRSMNDGLVKLSFVKTTKNNILFVIDDNMYYRSMRYDYVKLCRQFQVGYFQIFFDCDLNVALQRNSERTTSAPLPDEVIRRMYDKLQKPNPEYVWEKDHLTVPSMFDVDDHIDQLNELIAMKVMIPERRAKKTKDSELMQSENNTLELILRKEIHRRLENLRLVGTEPRAFQTAVDELNARKQFVRQKLKDKTFAMPDNLDDVKALLDTTLFQVAKQ